MKLTDGIINSLKDNWDCNPKVSIGSKIIILHSINGYRDKLWKTATICSGINTHCVQIGDDIEFDIRTDDGQTYHVTEGDKYALVSKDIEIEILTEQANKILAEIKVLKEYKEPDVILAGKVYDLLFARKSSKKQKTKDIYNVIKQLKNT